MFKNAAVAVKQIRCDGPTQHDSQLVTINSWLQAPNLQSSAHTCWNSPRHLTTWWIGTVMKHRGSVTSQQTVPQPDIMYGSLEKMSPWWNCLLFTELQTVQWRALPHRQRHRLLCLHTEVQPTIMNTTSSKHHRPNASLVLLSLSDRKATASFETTATTGWSKWSRNVR